MKKRLVSFALIFAMLFVLVPVGSASAAPWVRAVHGKTGSRGYGRVRVNKPSAYKFSIKNGSRLTIEFDLDNETMYNQVSLLVSISKEGSPGYGREFFNRFISKPKRKKVGKYMRYTTTVSPGKIPLGTYNLFIAVYDPGYNEETRFSKVITIKKNSSSSSSSKKAGWVKRGSKYSYRMKNGKWKKGWLTLNGNRYYLDSKGYRRTGWMKKGNFRYYFGPKGVMYKGWKRIGGKYYRFAEKSKIYRSNSYGLLPVGAMLHGGRWNLTDGTYYFNSNGSLRR